MHLQNGFIEIQKKKDETEAEKTAAKMPVKDASAQPTPKDYAKKGKKKPRPRCADRPDSARYRDRRRF